MRFYVNSEITFTIISTNNHLRPLNWRVCRWLLHLEKQFVSFLCYTNIDKNSRIENIQEVACGK